ncbi:hypothetical protein ACFLX4_03555 [Chloroflexota bacterium]
MSSTEIISVCELIHGAICRLKNLIRNAIPSIGKWESDVESANLIILISRDVESVILLARENTDLLPSALCLTRSVLEKAAKVMWMIHPDDPFMREIRWLAQLKTEEDHFARLAAFFNRLNIDATGVLQTRDTIKEFRIDVQNQLPSGYVPLKKLPDFNSVLSELGEEKKYLMFMHLSQYTHGTHVATSTYRRGLGTMKQPNKPITSRDWQIIFEVCFFCIGNAGLRLAERLGRDPADYLDQEAVNLIQDAITNLGSN